MLNSHSANFSRYLLLYHLRNHGIAFDIQVAAFSHGLLLVATLPSTGAPLVFLGVGVPPHLLLHQPGNERVVRRRHVRHVHLRNEQLQCMGVSLWRR